MIKMTLRHNALVLKRNVPPNTNLTKGGILPKIMRIGGGGNLETSVPENRDPGHRILWIDEPTSMVFNRQCLHQNVTRLEQQLE